MDEQHPPEVVDFVREVSRSGRAYHRIDFGGGLVMEGRWDLSPHLALYELPDVAGRSVLDVGTATGYFAVELARRGANVTAIDLWDGSFQRMVFRAANVDVAYVQMDLFDLDESFGTFDVVLCGSVLQHTWNQFEALRRLRSVCGRQAIVATAIMSERRPLQRLLRRIPVARLSAERGEGEEREYWSTWLPNETALVALMEAAGFVDVSFRGSFRLGLRQGIVHGYVA